MYTSTLETLQDGTQRTRYRKARHERATRPGAPIHGTAKPTAGGERAKGRPWQNLHGTEHSQKATKKIQFKLS